MKEHSPLALLESYRSTTTPSQRWTVLEELLQLHGSLLAGLCRRFARIHADVWTREDADQHAVIGAVRAYETYDPNGGCCLSTWVYQEVRSELQRSVCSSVLMRVPQRKALLVSLLQGRLDGRPSLKERARRRYGLDSNDAIRLAHEEYAPLICSPCALEVESAYDDSADRIALVDIARAISELPHRQRLALRAVALDGLNAAEAALHVGVTPAQLKSLLYLARKAVKLSLAR